MSNINALIDALATKLEAEVEEFDRQWHQDFYAVTNEVNDLYFKEVNKIYDSFIKEFYTKATERYIRHWEGRPGTGKGTNLYYGNQNKIHRGKDPYFEINYDSSNMADDYKFNSASFVLEGIVNGANIITGDKGGTIWRRDWSYSYKSRYFSYSGTLKGAYESFLSNYASFMEPVFIRRWKRYRNN